MWRPETLRRLRAELRAVPHAAHALTWIRGPKAVASPLRSDRIRSSLDITDLLRFFEPRLFSGEHGGERQTGPICSCSRPRAGVAPAELHRGSRIRSPASPPAKRRDGPIGLSAQPRRRRGSRATFAARRPCRDRRSARATRADHRPARVVTRPSLRSRRASAEPRRAGIQRNQ